MSGRRVECVIAKIIERGDGVEPRYVIADAPIDCRFLDGADRRPQPLAGFTLFVFVRGIFHRASFDKYGSLGCHGC